MNQQGKPAIPAGATKVFEGQVWSIWQWQQKMYDGSYETFEMVERPDATTALLIQDGKILLQEQMQPHREHPFLSLPGGRVDKGEKPEQAIRREVLEETGYEAQEVILWRSDFPSRQMRWGVYYYIIPSSKKILEPLEQKGEKFKNRWITFDEFFEVLNDPTFRDRGLLLECLKMQLDPPKKEAFRKLLGI